MLLIDGSQGEGGGQILRTALSLSLVTGAPFRIENVRAGRTKPGLLRQHLTAVQAATTVGDALVDGAELGSKDVVFRPRSVRPGSYKFAVGTAGSASLVLQAVLVPLLTAKAPSTLILEGGTHNPWAPPFDFLARAFLPLLTRMGASVSAVLERHGFYPAGGGKFTVEIAPCDRLGPLALLERGETKRRRAQAIVANLSKSIGHREINVVMRKMGMSPDEIEVIVLRADEREETDLHRPTPGPGNVVIIEIESEHVTEVFTGFGEIGVRAEAVAERAVKDAREYMAAHVPVGPCLADQLLVPVALAGDGAFRTMPLTPHSTTNIDVIRQFLDVDMTVTQETTTRTLVEVRCPS
jgi:RNA 3'-terminal phosphate cyclase (ATP)